MLEQFGDTITIPASMLEDGAGQSKSMTVARIVIEKDGKRAIFFVSAVISNGRAVLELIGKKKDASETQARVAAAWRDQPVL